MVNRACSWFWLFIIVVLVLTGSAVPFLRMADLGGDDWTVAEHSTSVNKDAINSAKSQVDRSSAKSKKEVRGKHIHS